MIVHNRNMAKLQRWFNHAPAKLAVVQVSVGDGGSGGGGVWFGVYRGVLEMGRQRRMVKGKVWGR